MLKVRASELVNGISNNQDPNTNSIADITITIRDVNDEPPVFNQPEYKVSLHENVPFGNFFSSFFPPILCTFIAFSIAFLLKNITDKNYPIQALLWPT